MWDLRQNARQWIDGRRRGGLFPGLVVSALVGTTGTAQAGEWTILTVNNRSAQGDAVITFNADATLSGSTGCNRFSAKGQFESGWLVIDGPVSTTRMACPGDALSTQEAQILSVFDHGFSVTYDPFTETLKLTGRSATVVLAPPVAEPTPDLKAIAPDPASGSEEAAVSPDTESAETPPSDGSTADAPTLFNTAYVSVHGLSGRLNVRAEASTSAKIVGGVHEGALLSNKGCEEQSDRIWCHVAHIGNGRPQGWVAAEYLTPAPAALRAGETLFDGIGTLPCITGSEGAARCDYGVAHDPDRTAAVVVFLPDGSEQLLVFRDGALLTEVGDATVDSPLPVATPEGEHFAVSIGQLRLEVPDAVVSPE